MVGMVARQRIADVLEHIVTELFGRKEPDMYWKNIYEWDKTREDYDFDLQRLSRIDGENGTGFSSHLGFLKNQFYEIDKYMHNNPLDINAARIAVLYFNELGALASELMAHPDIYKRDGRFIIANLFENMRYCSETLWLYEFVPSLPKSMADFERDYIR